jgi:hypothetical protein
VEPMEALRRAIGTFTGLTPDMLLTIH